jgi:NADH-quinone oxidoreductase subunit I
VLESFEIDYGLCMYCGICVEVCPFDALAWSPQPVAPRESAADLREGIADLGDRWPR